AATRLSDRRWQRASAEADDVLKPVTHEVNRIASVRWSALLRRNRANESHIVSRHQEAPSAAPEGRGESSPGQRSAATAALSNPPPIPTPLFVVRRADPPGRHDGPRRGGI